MLVQINCWSEAEKATYLAVSLRGPALTVLSNMTPEHLYNFRSLVSALDARFGSAHQAELNRMHLKSRARRCDDSLAELAEDVERRTRLAYPNAAASMIELLAKDQFINAIPDDETHLKIRQSRPESLRRALEVALELESFQLASLRRGKNVRAVTVRDQGREDGLVAQTSVPEQKPQWMEDLLSVCSSVYTSLEPSVCPQLPKTHTGDVTQFAGSAANSDTCKGTVQSKHKTRRCRETATSRVCEAKPGWRTQSLNNNQGKPTIE